MKLNSKNRKAQVWSIDLIIGLLVFILIIVIFYSLLSGERETKVQEYSDKADYVADRMVQEGLIDPVTGAFNREKFIELANEDYDELKQRLGITGEFCLFVESADDPPTVKFIVNETGQGWTGIGSSDLNISGFQCGTPVN